MMQQPVVPAFIVRQVVHRANEGNDPLLLGSGVDVPTALPVVRAAACGADDEQRPRIADALARLTDDPNTGQNGRSCDIDIVTARLLAHEGADPLTMSWIARCAGDATFPLDARPGAGEFTVRVWDDLSNTMTGTSLRLANGVTWWPNGNLIVPPLPEIVMATCAGLPLRDVVTHPAFDDMDLTMTSAQRGGPRMTWTYIVVEVGFESASLEDLIDLSAQLHKRRMSENPDGVKTTRRRPG